MEIRGKKMSKKSVDLNHEQINLDSPTAYK
jgi:hypothetical protein